MSEFTKIRGLLWKKHAILSVSLRVGPVWERAYGGCMMCRQDLYRVIGNVAMGQEPESLLPQ